MAADSSGNVYVVGDREDPPTFDQLANLQVKAAGSSNWTTIFQDTSGLYTFNAVATDAAGDVFVGAVGSTNGGTTPTWVVFEQPAGQSGFAVIDSITNGQCKGLATDPAGDVYASGSLGAYAAVRKLAPGQAGFTTVYQTSAMSFGSDWPAGSQITVIDSGASAGVYVVGYGSGNWKVIKGSNGGQSWSQVDSFRYDASGSSYPNAVIGDSSGHVYVAGEAYKSTVIGYDPRTRKPIYRNIAHWLVRRSGNGGASWAINDDFQMSSVADAKAFAAGADLAGNIYTAGFAIDSTGHDHAIVRSNAGGTWSTSDDYQTGQTDSAYAALTCDSAGNLYAGGGLYPWFIRSTAGPAALAAPTAGFDGSRISGVNLTVHREVDSIDVELELLS